MKRLAVASGWTWPHAPLEATLAYLADRSADWDFRRRLASASGPATERHPLTSIPADVAGTVLAEDLIKSAAAELGLAGGRPVTGAFTRVVALGGMARACLKRTREAARLRDELAISGVAVLTAHRPLAGNEPAHAQDAGWGALELESEAALAAARDVFGLADPPDSQAEWWWDGDESEAPDGLSPEEWRRRQSWSHRCWRLPGFDVEVVAAPSAEPSVRRTNTADQLVFWAERAGIGEADRLLLVTTDHYVPAQHFEAIRAVGLRLGCGVETRGVEWISTGSHQGAAYLQEIRSALLAAARLLTAVETTTGTGDGPAE